MTTHNEIERLDLTEEHLKNAPILAKLWPQRRPTETTRVDWGDGDKFNYCQLFILSMKTTKWEDGLPIWDQSCLDKTLTELAREIENTIRHGKKFADENAWHPHYFCGGIGTNGITDANAQLRVLRDLALDGNTHWPRVWFEFTLTPEAGDD